jgi:hypothetical protein
MPGETPFDVMERALLNPSTRNDVAVPQMPEEIPQSWRSPMLGEPFTTAVPEKVLDYVLVKILHSTLLALEPTA